MTHSYQKITKHYERTIVVGDIHGCHTEFQKLLEAVCFSGNDLLLAVGVMVDRGPGTWEIVRFFHETPNAHSVLGNHERRLAGTVHGTSQPAWSQRHSLSKIAKSTHLYWAGVLGSLPAVIETEHAIVAHARLDPKITIEKQDPYFTCAVGGPGVNIEKDPDDIPLWFFEWEKVFGNNKPICLGHSFYKKIDLIPTHLYALDTGAAKGGYFTAVVLPENRIVQIKSQQNYYEASRQEWSQIALDEFRPEKMKINTYFAIKKKDDKNEFEQRALHEFEKFLNTLEIQNLIEGLKEKIIKARGELPPAGPERGKYFMSIKEQFPLVNHRLMGMVLSPKRFKMEQFLKLFEGKNLLIALEEIENINCTLRPHE